MPTRVVIAEDEAIIRLDLKETLEEEGYEVVADVIKGSMKEGKTIREVVLERGLMSEADLDQALDVVEDMLNPRYT